jgi:hypothetical protein
MVFLTLANNVTADLDSAVTLLASEIFADMESDLKFDLFDDVESEFIAD